MGDLVSIIVPVYKVEPYLDQAILSMLGQTHKNLEIILVDDGSPDNCGKICDEYALKDKRIQVIHKQNGGQGQARNIALSTCRGDYITFLDSDDFLEPSFVTVLLELINRTESDIAVCNFNYVSEDGKFLSLYSNRKGEHQYNGYQALALIWNEDSIGLAPWAKLYRREFLGNFRFKECFCEDAASMPYLYKDDTKVSYIGIPLINYRLRSDSDDKSFSTKKTTMLDIFDDMILYAEKNLPKNLQIISKGKTVAVNFHVLFQLPNTGYDDVKKRIERTVKKYRLQVIFSPLVRKKTRLAALISYLGFGFTTRLFAILKKRNPAL